MLEPNDQRMIEELNCDDAPDLAPEQPKVEQIQVEPEQEKTDHAAEAAQWKSRYLRLAADFDNHRKRSAREVDDRVRQKTQRMVRDWLEVLDSVERALIHAPESSGPWYEGTLGIHRLLLDVLGRYGVEQVPALGKPFDPKVQEAVGVIMDPSRPSGSVAVVQTSGFKSADGRVVRPAQVLVVK